jgi:hypothetical protein
MARGGRHVSAVEGREDRMEGWKWAR